MPISRDEGGIIQITGIPRSHIAAFQAVANSTNCVIMSRAVGTSCTQLIEEGYASKGFHVKAKSCNWGPMAGFVLEDPNLTKRAPSEREKQANDLQHALQDWNASSTPLYISTARCKKLLSDGTIIKRGGDDSAMVVWGAQTDNRSDGSERVLRRYFFKLRQVPSVQLNNGIGSHMYAVKYVDPAKAEHTSDVEDEGHVHAMCNPNDLGGTAAGVRGAVTGDYDLFSLAIHKSLYSPGTMENRGTDARMISVRGLEQNIKAKKKDVGEDVHLGNMTGRLHQIRAALNSAFQGAGYTGGNMVHHSDEAGRPFVDDVDLPVFAVVPQEAKPFALSDLGDVREFFSMFIGAKGYVPMFNPGWMSELVFNKRGFGAADLQAGRQHLSPGQRT